MPSDDRKHSRDLHKAYPLIKPKTLDWLFNQAKLRVLLREQSKVQIRINARAADISVGTQTAISVAVRAGEAAGKCEFTKVLLDALARAEREIGTPPLD